MYPVPVNCGKGAAMFLLFLSLNSLQPGRAQCIVVGPKNPATSANVPYAGSDYSFHNPSNALLSDNTFAYAASLASLFNKTTDYLQVKNFGFNIPTAATICSIEANIIKSASDIDLLIISAWVKDYDVRIIKNNVLAGNNQKQSAAWADAPTTSTYNADPLWGTTWSPAEVNSSNFGLSIAAEIKTGIGLLPVVNIDNISLTVSYLDPSVLPAQVVQFNVANGSNNTAVLSWKQSSGDEATSFIIERSVNGLKWETLPGSVQKNNTASLFKDSKPLLGKSYYRLKMINAAGDAHYTTSLPFELSDIASLTCYPNPFTSVIQVKGLVAGEQVAVSNLLGQRVYLSAPAVTNILSININDLQPGMYVISAGNRKMKVEKR